jgi:RNA polymerase sigma-70 factor (ECF subfamily)
MTADADALLVERAKRGEVQAFEMLVVKYQRRIERLIGRMIRDTDLVADVAQETFIRAYRALPQFRGDSAFYTWLYRIGINTAKNYLIAQGRRAPTSTEYDSEEAESFEDAVGLRDINTPEAVLMSKQIGQTVNAAIDALPEELRTAITLREIDGLAYEEIAKIMVADRHRPVAHFPGPQAVAEGYAPLGTAKDKMVITGSRAATYPAIAAAKPAGTDTRERDMTQELSTDGWRAGRPRAGAPSARCAATTTSSGMNTT